MKGLYLDVPGAAERALDLDRRLGAGGSILTLSAGPRRTLVVDHHPPAWPQGPVLRAPDGRLLAAASGWLLHGGRWGHLESFAAAVREALAGKRPAALGDAVEGGASLVYVRDGDREALVTDPFGLHPHFARKGDLLGAVAPSPAFLAQGAPSPRLQGILEKQNHLFGDLTAYEDIVRLPPGCIITREGVVPYFDHARRSSEGPERLLAVLTEALRPLPEGRRVLPLSGGLDSRLVLAAGRFQRGYTFGPADRGDRPVARRFARRFEEYREFSLLDLEYPGDLRAAGRELVQGACARPFLEILGVYRDLRARWGDGLVFDGYLGDVLQRGTYLTSGGFRGALGKLWPALTLRNFRPLELLRRRYAALDDDEFRLVAEAFAETVGHLDLDDAARVLLFEILHGRGGRYALNGGTLFAGQYFVPVQPFFLPPVFRVLFPGDMEAKLSYRTVREVWRDVPAEFSGVRTYSGFLPTGNPHVARATMLAVKGLGRAGLFPRARGYETEVPLIRWRG